MTKVAVYVNDEVWKEFKRKSFEKYGTLRVISKETTQILKDYLMLDLPKALDKLIPQLKIKKITPAEIVKSRPIMKESSVKIIREMRGRRT